MHGGHNNRPVADQWVILHEIRQFTGGPVDSARTDARGEYRIVAPPADIGTLYFLVNTYQGVEYFSDPLPIKVAAVTRIDPLRVYDTTSRGPALRIERRLITLFRPAQTGSRTVTEIVEISNPDTRTRIPRDSGSPVWSITLPPGVRNWESITQSLSAEGLRVAGDTVKLMAPLWPGPGLRVSYQYSLGGRAVRIQVDQRTEQIGLLVEDTMASVYGILLDSIGVQEFEGRRFAAYRQGPIEAGAVIRLTFSRPPLTPERVAPYVVAATALSLALGLWIALKRRPPIRR